MPSIKRRGLALAATVAIALTAPLAVVAPSFADANHPNTNGNTNISSILSYDDTVKEMKKLEKTSRFNVDVFTLEEAGTEVNKSEAGRDLYVATVGYGPENVWLQGRIHGNEAYGADSLLEILKELGTNGSGDYELLRQKYTFHIIPTYNPDGTDLNIRYTQVTDANGTKRNIDLNRDWTMNGFVAKESKAFYEYWTMVDPAFGIDIHHQGLQVNNETGEDVSLSLGISLAPNGPTLPYIKDGEYNDLTRQMQVHVYDELSKYGSINMSRYTVGSGNNVKEIDIKGGVVSAMMLGLNYNGMNPEGHSNPVIFFETSGNNQSLGQKGRGKLIRQNVLAVKETLLGMATGETLQEDPDRWEEIPHAPLNGYQTGF